VEFNLTPDQELFRSTSREFLQKEMPLTKVRAQAAAATGFDRTWWRRGVELGWASMLVDPDRGGGSISGNGLLDLAIVAEEMGRLVSPGPLIAANVVALALSEASTADSHAEVLRELISGEKIATWAVYEPDRGWGPAGITMRAERHGIEYLLSGTKDRVESGDQADFFLVASRTDDGIAQFLVSAKSPGVSVIRAESLDIVKRFAEIRFENVRVPATALVSAPGDGAALERQLQVAGVLQCAEMVGAVDRVFEFTVEWAHDRYTFGRPLASYQALKHRFSDMRTWLEAAHATTGAAAQAVQDDRDDAAELVSIAKAYVGQRATDIVQDCVQMHGGIGVTWDHDIHLYLRRVTLNRVMWGTPSEHRRRVADLIGV
jgi:alkylation response protein AidB-like acyl-CoA dehydrogenase